MSPTGVVLRDMTTNFDGFSQLVTHAQSLVEENDSVRLDLAGLKWVDCNLCAPLGAILLRQKLRFGIKVSLPVPPEAVHRAMIKTHFLRQLEQEEYRDANETAIEYRQFKTLEGASAQFVEYVSTHFRHGHKGLPRMSEALLKKFRESLFEMFENALEHSYTEIGVFACGQFYPKNHRLVFSIADAGIGFAGNVMRNWQRQLSSLEAVQWALRGGTSRRGGRPGGLGLGLIQEFIRLNRGRLIVVSGDAYHEQGSDGEITKSLPYPFPGSVLTIDIDTSDESSYFLRSEVNPDDVF